jgi:hypothetical protein
MAEERAPECVVREIAMRWRQLHDDAEWLLADIYAAADVLNSEEYDDAFGTINSVLESLINDCPRLFRSPLRKKRKAVRRG